VAAAVHRGGDAAATLAALAHGEILPVYLLYGDEDYLVERARDGVLARLGARLSLLRARPGEDGLVGRVEDALRSGSLFGGKPAVLVSGAQDLSEAEQEGLLGILPTETVAHLVLVAGAPDMRRRLFATCARRGWAFEFPRLAMGRVPVWLRQEAQARGCALGTDAAELLVELTGPDLRAATGEIEKLSLYVGSGRPIDATVVAEVVGSRRARSMFELADHVQRREVSRALAVLRTLLEQGAEPVAIAAFLAGQLRRMIVAAELGGQKRPAGDVAQALGLPLWVAERINDGARRYGVQRLRATLRRLADVDVSLKSSRLDRGLLLESFVLGLRRAEGVHQTGQAGHVS
jgi:DNA polymerase-3 subunit delta